ncbi:MAG: hypothetical protein WAW52_09360 [Methanothrix sp.]
MKSVLLSLIVIGVVALALAAGLFHSAKAADYGPNAPYFTPAYDLLHPANERHFADKGFLFDESSTVRGSGEISIKGSFHDHAVDSSGWMKGSGSINFESLRNMNKIGKVVDFTQKADLVFSGGQLKNKKSLKLPLFEKGIGASVSERFNLSHVDKNETNMIRSINRFNNTMVYDTALAFEGLWDIKNMRGWSINMNRSEQSYSGSFQTQKKIEFDDSGKA